MPMNFRCHREGGRHADASPDLRLTGVTGPAIRNLLGSPGTGAWKISRHFSDGDFPGKRAQKCSRQVAPLSTSCAPMRSLPHAANTNAPVVPRDSRRSCAREAVASVCCSIGGSFTAPSAMADQSRSARSASFWRVATYAKATGREKLADLLTKSSADTARGGPLACPKLIQWPQDARAAKFSSKAASPKPSTITSAPPPNTDCTSSANR